MKSRVTKTPRCTVTVQQLQEKQTSQVLAMALLPCRTKLLWVACVHLGGYEPIYPPRVWFAQGIAKYKTVSKEELISSTGIASPNFATSNRLSNWSAASNLLCWEKLKNVHASPAVMAPQHSWSLSYFSIMWCDTKYQCSRCTTPLSMVRILSSSIQCLPCTHTWQCSTKNSMQTSHLILP